MVSIKRPSCSKCYIKIRLSLKMYRLYINTGSRGKNSINRGIGWVCLNCKGIVLTI